MKFTIDLAGLAIELDSCGNALKEFCVDYLTDNTPDFSLRWSESDIEAERGQNPGEAGYSSDYLETLAALRSIAERLPLKNRILIHGAAITWKDTGYLFTAPSGTGKTTHIRLWKNHLGANVDIVNGDKPILSLEGGEICVHGTPWAGKERWQKNRSAELRGICFVTRGEKNEIRRMAPDECVPMLIRQIYLPADQKAAERTLELADELARRVPMYLLRCDISEDAVRCSFSAMTGEAYPK